ncbi:MAG: lytic transglycosylase domain-containing protein [Hyphomicrobiales bacterium]|nr:lytic transglycosylase domain-containing protein [Hyphomicrobiales bacterium]
MAGLGWQAGAQTQGDAKTAAKAAQDKAKEKPKDAKTTAKAKDKAAKDKTKDAKPRPKAKEQAKDKKDKKTVASTSDQKNAKKDASKASADKGGKSDKTAAKSAKPKSPSSKSSASKSSASKSSASKSSASKNSSSENPASKSSTASKKPSGKVPSKPVTSASKVGGGAAAVVPSLALAATSSTSAADVAAVKQAIAHARAGRAAQASGIQRSIQDPLARKLVEWAILRSDGNGASSSRYIAFIAANPGWPSVGMLRRRAESMIFTEEPNPADVRAYFAKYPPLTARGQFALARALLAQGDRASAQALVHDAWRNEAFGGDVEAKVLEMFGRLISADDHRARMNMRLYAEDTEGGLRNANRAGGDVVAIAKARVAVIRKAGNAKASLDAVPSTARRDLGYIFSLAQWLRRADRSEEAGELILAAPRDPSQALDTDQWWVERRLAARKMLDLGHPAKAYRIARDAVPPKRDNYRAEHQFTAGWIALRFLNDPATAQTHFARIIEGTNQTITLARGHYWLGRAYEAQGRSAEARTQYQAAAQRPTAYYGQLAAARIGLRNIALRAPPPRPAGALEVVRAVELLYAADAGDMVAGAAADLGDRSSDAAGLAAIGEVAARAGDARAMLLLGKAALARGLPLDTYAFPTIGMPNYTAIGPAVEKPLVYAIARQESTFNQRTVSSARAMGLMQVTPAAGRYVAKKFNVTFNEKKLLSDPVYNVQLGAAELGDLLADFRGSYILAFVGYNAGRGRIRDWVARYGDPRDPKVDPVDWVERIPFSETRNYVQRVMENMQVYRIRFGGGDKLMIEADLRRGASAN